MNAALAALEQELTEVKRERDKLQVKVKKLEMKVAALDHRLRRWTP